MNDFESSYTLVATAKYKHHYVEIHIAFSRRKPPPGSLGIGYKVKYFNSPEPECIDELRSMVDAYDQAGMNYAGMHIWEVLEKMSPDFQTLMYRDFKDDR